MIYIKVHSVFYYTNEFVFPDFETEALNPISVDDLPDYYFDETHTKFDVYSLFIGKSGLCKQTEISDIYYQVDLDKSMFFLIDSLNDIEDDCQIFSYWQASKRENDYYLSIYVYSVMQSLLQNYVAHIYRWIDGNGHLINNDEFCLPEPIINHKGNIGQKTKTNKIIATDKKRYGGHVWKHIVWDTDFPEFEGVGGEEAVVYLTAALTVAGLFMNYFGIATPEQRENRRIKKEIRNSYKSLLRKYQIDGDIRFPSIGEQNYDENGNRIYNFDVYKNENFTTTYYVIVKSLKYGVKRYIPKKSERV